jgi:hypothetical protein
LHFSSKQAKVFLQRRTHCHYCTVAVIQNRHYCHIKFNVTAFVTAQFRKKLGLILGAKVNLLFARCQPSLKIIKKIGSFFLESNIL